MPLPRLAPLANAACLQIFWAFCVYLEAVSVLPQLRMMQKAKVGEGRAAGSGARGVGAAGRTTLRHMPLQGMLLLLRHRAGRQHYGLAALLQGPSDCQQSLLCNHSTVPCSSARSLSPPVQVVEKFTAHYVFALGLSRFISCAHWILQVGGLGGKQQQGQRWQALAVGSPAAWAAGTAAGAAAGAAASLWAALCETRSSW